MDTICLNHKNITFETIAHSNFDAGLFNPFEQHTLQFLQAWLKGKKIFSIPTSGTTGRPSAIQITRTQMETSARMTGKAFALSPGDHLLVCLNTTHIAGKMMLVRGLVLGLQMTIIDPTANPLANFSANFHFDFSAMVPLQIQAILQQSPYKKDILDHMKALIIGGAPVHDSLEKMLQNIQTPIFSTFSMTETLSHIALRRLNGPKKSVYYYLLDKVKAKVDERGCLVVSTPATHYKNIISNDLVAFVGTKKFQWLGRYDYVVNSGGYKIQVEQLESMIEKILQSMALPVRFFMTGLPDTQWGEKLVLIIEGKPFTALQEKNLLNVLSKKTCRYEIPKAFMYLPYFETTPTQKIKRQATLKKYRLLTRRSFLTNTNNLVA